MNIDPDRAAVLVLHFERDIAEPGGTFGGLLAPSIARHGVLGRTARVLDAARAAGVTVVYGRVSYAAGHPGLDPAIPLYGIIVEQDALVQGTAAVEMVDELAPAPGDAIVDHTGTSAFGGGELERLLQRRAVDTVVIAGVATNIVVESTARDAANRGLRAFVLADCCAAGEDSAHDASLATLGMLTHGVVTSDAFLGCLRAAA